ncbi:MAG: DUF4258 domain-containing protein [Acidobacteria bacterium]|nr:DUF4258 domain-containing protein [Acidobacteriota bacterium]
MAKREKIFELLREKVRHQEYEFAFPHFFEEMANDELIFADIETAIASGKINQIYTDAPRGARFEIVGRSTDDRLIAVICRIKETGKLLFITTWEIYE